MRQKALKTALTGLLSLSVLLSAYSCYEESAQSYNSNESSEQTNISSTEEKSETVENHDSRKFVKEKYDMPRDIGCLYRLKKINEKLYFTGIEGIGYPYHLDIRSKKLDTDCYGKLDCRFIHRALTTDNRNYVVYSCKSSDLILCSTDLTDGKLINKTELTGINRAEAMYLDADQNICILSVTDQKEAAFNVYSSDLDLLNTISLTEKLQLNDNEIITQVLNDGNDSFYFLTYEKTDDKYENPALRRIDLSGELIFKSTMPMLEYNDLTNRFIAKNGNLFISSCNNESESLKLIEISKDTGEEINEYEIPVVTEKYNFRIISEDADSEYDFIYKLSDGIYGYTLSDNVSSEIIKFSDYPAINFGSYGFSCTGENELVIQKGQPLSSKYNCTCVYNENDIDDHSLCTVSLGEMHITSGVSDDGFIYRYTYRLNSHDTFDFKLEKINDSGEIVNSVDCNELSAEDRCLYRLDKVINNKIYTEISDNNGHSSLLVLNDDGTKNAEIQLSNNILVCDIVCADETDYMIFESDKELKIAKIDYENNKLDENTGFKNIDLHNAVPHREKFPSGSPEYDFYYQTDEGLFGCLIKEDKTDKLLDFAEQGLNSRDIKVYWIDEDEIIYSLYITDGTENGYYHLKRVE